MSFEEDYVKKLLDKNGSDYLDEEIAICTKALDGSADDKEECDYFMSKKTYAIAIAGLFFWLALFIAGFIGSICWSKMWIAYVLGLLSLGGIAYCKIMMNTHYIYVGCMTIAINNKMSNIEKELKENIKSKKG